MNFCDSKLSILRGFIKATRGNWHHAVYIKCSVCWHSKCQKNDFLCAADYDGRPMVISKQDAESFFGERISKEDCLFQIKNKEFEEFYFSFIQDKIDDFRTCPLLIISDFVWKEPVKSNVIGDYCVSHAVKIDTDNI